MIPDLDIFRSAKVLIREYGADAALEDAIRTDPMLDAGWGRYKVAIPKRPRRYWPR